jgi:hypothetical protein
MRLSKRVGDALKSYSGKNNEKLQRDFVREFKKLRILSKDLVAQERRIIVSNEVDLEAAVEEIQPTKSQKSKLDEKISFQQLDLEAEQLKQRKEALKQIEKDVVTLNDMMKDMAFLVDEQQDVIDSIEYNIISTANSTKKAEQELVTVS